MSPSQIRKTPCASWRSGQDSFPETTLLWNQKPGIRKNLISPLCAFVWNIATVARRCSGFPKGHKSQQWRHSHRLYNKKWMLPPLWCHPLVCGLLFKALGLSFWQSPICFCFGAWESAHRRLLTPHCREICWVQWVTQQKLQHSTIIEFICSSHFHGHRCIQSASVLVVISYYLTYSRCRV